MKKNGLEDKITELNAENYNFKQENQELKKKNTNLTNKLETLNQELSILRIEKQQNSKKKGNRNSSNDNERIEYV